MFARPLTWIVLLAALLALTVGVWKFGGTGRVDWRQALSALPGASSSIGRAPPASARKCRDARQVVYTDGPCPPGLSEVPLDGGSLTVLPAPRVASPSPAMAASASSPLRRLAGPGQAPAVLEHQVEQALQR